MQLNLTPDAATPEYVQNMSKIMQLTEEQRFLLCDLGYYNEIIQGYLLSALGNAGFNQEDIDNALAGLYRAFDEITASEARKVYRNHK